MRRIAVALCLGFVCLFGASCGQTYTLQAITITPKDGLTLSTPGQTESISVTAYFKNSTSSKSLGVSYQSSYTITPPDSNVISTAPAGAVLYQYPNLIKADDILMACTYSGAVDYPYTVTASYTSDGVTKTASIPVTVTDGCP
jgi:hypothetical protein